VGTVPVKAITLVYVCEDHDPEDGYEYGYQPLADIVSVGTLICPECGEDMSLTDAVNVR
jgi:hypothetical protein